MERMEKLAVLAAVLALAAGGVGVSSARADEVLVNGNLESSVAPVGWSIETFLSDDPTTAIPTVFEHTDDANNPAVQGLGILLHPQAGNNGLFEGEDRLSNFILEKTFAFGAAAAGRTFTFSGDVYFADGYSGAVPTLNPVYPAGDFNESFAVDAADYVVWRENLGQFIELPNEGGITPLEVTPEDYDFWAERFGNKGHGAIESPTTTKFELAFLNATNTVLETPVELDLSEDTTVNAWRRSSVMGLAPAGTTQIRMRAMALDMIDNAAFQRAMFDNFSLRDNVSPGLERLSGTQNGNLNTPGDPAGWKLTEGPTVDQGAGPVTADSAAFIGFANRLISDNPTPPHNASGQQGLWLRAFVNETQFEPDIASTSAVLEQTVPGTPGAEYEFSAWSAWEAAYSGGLGGATETFMKIEFLDSAMVLIGTPAELDLAEAGQVNDDDGGIETDDWRQFFLTAVAPAGTVSVRVSLNATGMYESGFELPQSAFFDEMSLIETIPVGAGGIVPEPSALALVGIAVGMLGVGRRRG